MAAHGRDMMQVCHGRHPHARPIRCDRFYEWISPKQCFEFWRREVHGHLFDPEGDNVDAFPDQYAYLARRWQTAQLLPVVVLEKHH